MANCRGNVKIKDCLTCPFPDCIWTSTANVISCNDCECCTEVLVESGDKATRLCLKSRRLIKDKCQTKPSWCKGRNQGERKNR